MTQSTSASPPTDHHNAGQLPVRDAGSVAPPSNGLHVVNGGPGRTEVDLGAENTGAHQGIDPDTALELFHLRRRLETLPVVEQSKGILIGHYGIDADAAFDLLRRWACDNNLKLRDISRQIVAAATATGPHQPSPSLRHFLHRLQQASAGK